MFKNPINPTIDYDSDGIQHGFLKLPHSHDESAWGSIMIPITVAKNGEGPTFLLTGGNHGDEYEGPVALFDLANKLKPEDITGRIIIVPCMNYPAFKAARRTSPIDSGNLNRVFPGNPKGTVTEKIADYFERTLLPLSDYVLDIHSGGKTLDFVPFCSTHVLEDKKQQGKCAAAMHAFNAPYSTILLEIDSTGMFDASAEEMGKIFITTELGGGGSASASTIAIAKKGISNVLKHAGIIRGEPEISNSIDLTMPDEKCFVPSVTTGLLEMCAELGDHVEKGQIIARIHNTEHMGIKPVEYPCPLNGIFIGRHYPGLITSGDIIAVIALEVTEPA